MRHRKSGKKLNRNSSHRKALFRNLSIALIEHEIIKTTLPKAKELRRFLEPLVTMAKVDSVANKRLVFARLRNKEALEKLFRVISPECQHRPGGYLRIIKAGYRVNDAAPVAYIEFVDRNTFRQNKDNKDKKEKSKTEQKTRAITDVQAADTDDDVDTDKDKVAKVLDVIPESDSSAGLGNDVDNKVAVDANKKHAEIQS